MCLPGHNRRRNSPPEGAAGFGRIIAWRKLSRQCAGSRWAARERGRHQGAQQLTRSGSALPASCPISVEYSGSVEPLVHYDPADTPLSPNTPASASTGCVSGEMGGYPRRSQAIRLGGPARSLGRVAGIAAAQEWRWAGTGRGPGPHGFVWAARKQLERNRRAGRRRRLVAVCGKRAGQGAMGKRSVL